MAKPPAGMGDHNFDPDQGDFAQLLQHMRSELEVLGSCVDLLGKKHAREVAALGPKPLQARAATLKERHPSDLKPCGDECDVEEIHTQEHHWWEQASDFGLTLSDSSKASSEEPLKLKAVKLTNERDDSRGEQESVNSGDANPRRSGMRHSVASVYEAPQLWPDWREELTRITKRNKQLQVVEQGTILNAVGHNGMNRTSDSRNTVGHNGKNRTSDSRNTVGFKRGSHDKNQLWVHNFILSPSSFKRLVWDITGMVAILYDLITIPLQAFEPPQAKLTVIMGWSTATYWTLDIIASILVGYHTSGGLEMRFWKIFRHYVKTWFVPDVVICLFDWLVTVGDILTPDNTQQTRKDDIGFLRLMRFSRFLRMIRLLRIMKVSGILAELFEHIQSESCQIMLGIVGLIMLIFVANHVIACGFWAIGKTGHNEDSWVYVFHMDDKNLGYQYTTALHWSLTQFTPASMEITPKNLQERIFTVCTLLLAMITFSSFVSSLTNAMTRLRHLSSESQAQMSQLRRYLKENRVSNGLVVRVMAWFQSSTQTVKARLKASEVKVMTQLPNSLRHELQDQVYLPVLCKHPLFGQLVSVCPEMLRKVYPTLEEISLRKPAELFIYGDECKHMYFVVTGNMHYYHANAVDEIDVHEVRKNNWLCEAALWMRWKHRGTLVAVDVCCIFAIVAAKFREVVLSDLRNLWQIPRYAKLFFQRAHVGVSTSAWSDLQDDFHSTQEMAWQAFAEVSDGD